VFPVGSSLHDAHPTTQRIPPLSPPPPSHLPLPLNVAYGRHTYRACRA
jgi:hypothetical protein